MKPHPKPLDLPVPHQAGSWTLDRHGMPFLAIRTNHGLLWVAKSRGWMPLSLRLQQIKTP